MPSFDIRRADGRYVTRVEGMETLHSFSYGDHYDPDNVGFGFLRAINEEVIAPGAGYHPHRHEDVEIVTWVLDGLLAHEDTAGQSGVVPGGVAQRLSAGTGVSHGER
ncbi:MAG: hypothetical protein JWP10_1363, partial [Nocardioidaceae bacterium]|nr:hypothetical protein [Nocardioidaceae bacterium]